MGEFRRVVIDSRYKTADSNSDSDFSIDLVYPMLIPKGSLMYVEGISLSHSWPVIQKDLNDKVYVLEQIGSPGSSADSNRIAVLTPGTYNSVQLAGELQSKLNAASALASVGGGSYQWTCTVDDGRITVMHNIPNSIGRGYLYAKDYTDDPATYLSSPTLHASAYPRPDGQAANEVLGYLSNQQSDVYIHSANPLTFQFMDLQRHKQLFLCAPGLGECSMQLLNGDTTCIRRILVGSSMQGDVITDVLQTGLASITFPADETLTRMRFILKGWDGKPVATGGHQLSFELVVMRPE